MSESGEYPYLIYVRSCGKVSTHRCKLKNEYDHDGEFQVLVTDDGLDVVAISSTWDWSVGTMRPCMNSKHADLVKIVGSAGFPDLFEKGCFKSKHTPEYQQFVELMAVFGFPINQQVIRAFSTLVIELGDPRRIYMVERIQDGEPFRMELYEGEKIINCN